MVGSMVGSIVWLVGSSVGRFDRLLGGLDVRLFVCVVIACLFSFCLTLLDMCLAR